AEGSPGVSVNDLPQGDAPAALNPAHFPDRLHAFVWRNWDLVPAERMARTVSASVSQIVRIGRSMGLKGPPKISSDQQARSYITVIKRNWHLLPYSQLLKLLNFTAAELAYILREDDFLFVKLGNLKPRCQPLAYQAPSAAAMQRAGEIAQEMRRHLAATPEPAEPLFGFIAQLSSGTRAKPFPSDYLKFCYSYFALYGDPLLDKQCDPYPEGYLARLAEAGVNGVWLQAVLYKLAPYPWQPALSADSEKRLSSLGKLVARARKHGIQVFLYLNEPRAMPLRFYSRHPELKGAPEGDHAALCTSVPEVKQYLTQSVARICQAVPDLGGFFTITASENLTNCWSHGQGAACPRCAKRTPAEVVAEVNTAVREGIRQANAPARLIAWDWGWNDTWAPEAIRQLPPQTALMSVSEWRLPVERGGVKTEVGEYSISAVGPGPRARRHWELARQAGLTPFAKIQAGNTWELSSVPYVPAVENVAQHAENLAKSGLRHLMLGWTLGGYPSPNLQVVSETLACGSAQEGMQRVARQRFGPNLAPAVLKAWHGFSQAFSEFPYHIGTVYSGPQQLGPANLLWPEPTGHRATMVGFPYDDVDAWRAVYPVATYIQQLEKVAHGFDAALRELRTATAPLANSCTRLQATALEAECRVAEAVAIHYQSAANQARFVVARRALTAGQDREQNVAVLQRVLQDEIRLAGRLHQLQTLDSRLG
ncbi:MAG TPA: hypothetical protein VN673_09945, partial [Clostridia bacterium]|nr:hypothetical protein [Clostridia bacterium]